MRVAVVQGGAPPARAGAARRAAGSLRGTDHGGRRAAGRLIVWPEYATEAYLEEASPTREAVLRLRRRDAADLILGGPHYAASPSGTRYHNSAYLVRDGRLAARYDKHRLVPFAEDGRLVAARRAGDQLHARSRPFVLPATALRVGDVAVRRGDVPRSRPPGGGRGRRGAGQSLERRLVRPCRAGAPAARHRDAARRGESALPGARRGDRLLGRDRPARPHPGAERLRHFSKFSTRPCAHRTSAHRTNAGATPSRGW